MWFLWDVLDAISAICGWEGARYIHNRLKSRKKYKWSRSYCAFKINSNTKSVIDIMRESHLNSSHKYPGR